MNGWKVIVDIPDDVDEIEVFQSIVALKFGCQVTLILEEEVK